MERGTLLPYGFLLYTGPVNTTRVSRLGNQNGNLGPTRVQMAIFLWLLFLLQLISAFLL